MRVAVAIVALGGFLVWEAWSERARHRIALLLERLPALLVQITVDMTAWQLAMEKMAEQPKDRSPDAVVDQSTFERAIKRRNLDGLSPVAVKHREREEELRRG